MRLHNALCFALIATLGPLGCGGGDPLTEDDLTNPFIEDNSGGKEDTAYQNPDGVEVEVDLEADVEAPSYRIFDAPADLGQFAVTYMRERNEFYLESLAEAATSDQRVEWLVDGEWITAQQARSVAVEKLRRFRIRGMNAVILHGLSQSVRVGQAFQAEIPIRPYAVMTEAGDACANPDSHMGLSSSIYWYLWNPDRSNCQVQTQQATLTISQLFQNNGARYPEYDRLIEDNRVTAVVLFGQIGDGAITDSDPGMRAFNTMANWLKQAGFEEVQNPPVGRRFRKTVNGIELLYDLYSPRDFSGLSDSAHFSNFQRAISEHEIIAYDGHSMLGASDFWGRPTYPEFYQIFLYGGCLGYEYYIQPILQGKGGWENVDILSSVVEVSANANYYAAPFLARLEEAIQNGYAVSWADMLSTIRRRVGDSTFGVCGVEDNCFTPTGSRCTEEPPPDVEPVRVESTTPVAIPDNDPNGVTSVINFDQQLTASQVSIELVVTHTWVGDLQIIVEHNGVEAVIWDQAGGSTQNIQQTFTVEAFQGVQASGAWTLRLSDHADRDTGSLQSWAVVVTP